MSWEKEALGDLFSVGSSKRVLKSQWQTSGVPFYRGREVTKLATNGAVDNELFISENLYAEFEKQFGVPKAGDIVITAIGTIGNAYVVRANDRFYFKDASVLWLSKKRRIESGFVNYWLQSPLFKRQLDKANGATVDTLTIQKLKSVQIDLAPLPEQRRIVAILDEAFAGIATAVANTEKNLANARELFESYLKSVFNQRGEGWEDKRLSEVCTLSSGGTPSKKEASYWNGDIPWVSGRDMKSTRLSDSALHVSEAAIKESSTRMAPAGTILVLVRGMGLAHGAQLAELIAPCAFNQDIRGVHPNANMVPRYLLFALRDRINSSDRVLRSAAHGTLKLDSTELVNLVIPVSPVSQQEQIVADVDRIAEESLHLKTIYQQKLNALSELKQSLLQKAFSGELTAAPQDEIETALA